MKLSIKYKQVEFAFSDSDSKDPQSVRYSDQNKNVQEFVEHCFKQIKTLDQ